MDVIDNIMDFLFIADIFINFRTIVFEARTNEEIHDSKIIAKTYIFKGRFFVDLLASIPVELIQIMVGDGISRNQLRIISLLKLTRLLRLGRIVTFIKFNKNFKHGLRVGILALYLILILHWFACFSYFGFVPANNWIPPKDMDDIDGVDQVYVTDNPSTGYVVMFYYAALFLMGNDIIPSDNFEIGISFLFVFIGIITLGLLIAEFASLVNDITKKA